MSRVMTHFEKESKESLEKTLEVNGRVSLMAVLTLADLRLRRMNDDLREMTGFAVMVMNQLKHSGEKDCPRCKLEREYGMLPKWRRVMIESDPESAACLRMISQRNFCPMRKGNQA